MVSHQPSHGSDVRMSRGSDVRMSRGSDDRMSERPSSPPRGMTGAGKERRREADSIYHSHPIPGMPPALLNRPRPSRDSMLDYSERMRQISKGRTDVLAVTTPGDHERHQTADAAAADPSSPPQTILEIQARHIPRTGQQQRHGSKPPAQRRPMSLDELIGRRGKTDEASATTKTGDGRSERCMSEPPPPHIVIPPAALALPSSPSSSPRRDSGVRGGGANHREEKRIRINFVSTADLFDLVDFSLRGRKAEHVQLARVDDTLRLINEANFFRSLSGRRKMKLPGVADRESDVDSTAAAAGSLVVRGTSSSPKEGSRDRGDHEAREDCGKDGDWARKEMANSVNPYDSDDEDEVDEDEGEDEGEGADLDSDLIIQDRRKMLMLPQKLHFRPMRAKRMRLHRSMLSAIPEDEHAHHHHHPHRQRTEQQRPAAWDQELSVRVPPIPSTASLAAIKRTRHLEPLTAATDTAVKKTTERTDSSDALRGSSEEESSPRPHPVHNTENRDAKKSTCHPQRHGRGSENGSVHGQPAESPPTHHDRGSVVVKTDHGRSSRKKDTARRVVTGLRNGSSSLPGRSVAAEASDTHQKKIRKIVFLRDLPE